MYDFNISKKLGRNVIHEIVALHNTHLWKIIRRSGKIANLVKWRSHQRMVLHILIYIGNRLFYFLIRYRNTKDWLQKRKVKQFCLSFFAVCMFVFVYVLRCFCWWFCWVMMLWTESMWEVWYISSADTMATLHLSDKSLLLYFRFGLSCIITGQFQDHEKQHDLIIFSKAWAKWCTLLWSQPIILRFNQSW